MKKMLESDEEYRIDFDNLKTLIPDYEQVKNFFTQKKDIDHRNSEASGFEKPTKSPQNHTTN